MVSRKNENSARRLEIKGIVQGVGFRPFVYQLANRHGIRGEVANTSAGVSIHIEGDKKKIESFLKELTEKRPPLSLISEILSHPDSIKGFNDFSITPSRSETFRTTLVAPDVSICDDCLRELFSTDDRRFHYPFINCTNCGPRYTIISDIPYDRPNTSMNQFKMCERCQAEYDDPADRRFHAQPNACSECGPTITLYDDAGKRIKAPNVIDKAVALLKQGYILAIKGLGGFHLAADAENDEAVVRLRKRKYREEKPFAIMSYNEASIRKYAHVEPEEHILLSSFQRPIVILKKKMPNPISEAVSPRNNYFGVMLPYTPLHYLILRRNFTALVMTSGNLSEEPIAIDNEDAFKRLFNIADFFLTHNRGIYLRSDDSIVKKTAGAARLIRRSRGYVPVPVFLKHNIPHILACGAELKNTICLTKGKEAFLSQHIGDLKNLETYAFFKLTIEHLKRILDINPEIVAYDLHPDYLSTRYAEELPEATKIPVQHHHAHIVSCMAENKLDGPVIGLSFDGVGYGLDGKIWGGEILIAETGSFIRKGHLSYVPMPGGAAAIKAPWRMAISYLYDAFGKEFQNLNIPLLKQIETNKLELIVEMISKKINSPDTSSLGRLFDGIAALIGIRNQVFFEGQAAMELEMTAQGKTAEIYPFEWVGGDVYEILLKPLICGIVDDIQKQIPPAIISSKFHWTLIHIFAELCDIMRKESRLTRIVLSGGVFQNSILLSGLKQALEEKKFQVFTHSLVPTNDGGISLGQALVANSVATHKQGKR